MGLIKALTSAVGGNLADQWKDAISCERMDNTVMLRYGRRMNQGKGSNYKGNPNIISNGSTILVEENVCMLTIDGGKITNIVAEPGGYVFESSAAPSIFAGQVADSLKDALRRFAFGGTPAMEQRVVYINLQQLPGIKFGTSAPVPYPDPRYNTTIDLRFHGTFEIQIPDAEMAVRFYQQVASKGSGDMTVSHVFSSDQYKREFMQSLKVALGVLSTQGVSYGQISMHLDELTNNVRQTTRENWGERGFTVTRIGMSPVTLSDESKELLKDRLKADTMLGGDIQRAVMVGGVARGIEAAANNDGGAMVGLMGMNMATNVGGGVLAQMPTAPTASAPSAGSWACACGSTITSGFCPDCGTKKPEEPKTWTCSCGAVNTKRFCGDCGKTEDSR